MSAHVYGHGNFHYWQQISAIFTKILLLENNSVYTCGNVCICVQSTHKDEESDPIQLIESKTNILDEVQCYGHSFNSVG